MSSTVRRAWFLGPAVVLACGCGGADPSNADASGGKGDVSGATVGSGGHGAESGASSGGASSITTGSGGGPTTKQVPIVVAQGFVGRTTISCDDGQTWIANRSFDIEGNNLVCGDTTPVKCGTTPCKMVWTDGTCSQEDVCDCVHGTGYSKGVAIAEGQIWRTSGGAGRGRSCGPRTAEPGT